MSADILPPPGQMQLKWQRSLRGDTGKNGPGRMASHVLCQDWAGFQRPSCHRLPVCSAQAGGPGILPGEATTRNASPSFSPRMLLCSVTPLSQLCHHHSWQEPIVNPGLTTAWAAGFSCWDRLGQQSSAWRRARKVVTQECRNIRLLSTTATICSGSGHPTPLLKGYTCPCDHTMPHPIGGEGKEDNLSTHRPALHQHHSRQPPSCSKCSSPLGTSRSPVA